jgi:hypothetical protein
VAAFSAVSLLDLLLTWLLLERAGGAYEANPLAAAVLARLGWAGLAGFKAVAVAAVLALALAIGRRRRGAGLAVLRLGCAALALVVGHSLCLLARQAAGRAEDERALAAQEAAVRDRVRMAGQTARAAARRRELAAAVAAGQLDLSGAVEELAAYLREIGHDPLPYLRGCCGDLSADACLAAHVVREVGLEVQGQPARARRLFDALRRDFAAYHPTLPDFATEPFAGILAGPSPGGDSAAVARSRAPRQPADPAGGPAPCQQAARRGIVYPDALPRHNAPEAG